MGTVSISTDEVAAGARLDYWRESVQSAFVRLECSPIDQSEFTARLQSYEVADLGLSKIVASAQRVVRHTSSLAPSDPDPFFICIQLSGQGSYRQSGLAASLRPGDFVFVDSTRSYELAFPKPFAQLVVTLPRARVTRVLPGAARLAGATVRGDRGAGQLASKFFRDLACNVSSVSPHLGTRFRDAGLELLAAAFANQQPLAGPTDPGRAALLEQLLSYINDHLGDSELSCSRLAKAHRISERYLRALFASLNTTASEWIWDHRLERALRELTTGFAADPSITAVGFRCGFKDSAHFSHAFRKRYGVSPREARASGLTGQ